MQDKIIRIGVIGIGIMGYNHVRVLTELDNVDVSAICDANDENIIRAKKRFKISDSYKNYPDLLKKDLIDGLVISSPTQTHYEIAKLSLENKIPTLIEKPIALNIEQAQELVDLAKKHQVPLFAGYVERFNPVVRQLKNIIKEGLCGKIQHINITRVNSFPLRMAKRRIGVVTDLSTHDIDLLQYITGKSITNLYGQIRYIEDFDVYAQVLFDLTDNVSAKCEWSWISPYRRRTIEVVCEFGALVADLTKQSLFFHKNPMYGQQISEFETNFLKVLEFGYLEDEVTKYVFHREEPLKLQLNEFIQLIRDGKQTDCQYAVDILKVMNAIYNSEKQGKRLSMLNQSK